MITDPRPALAEWSELVNGLLGLAGLAGTVRALAVPDPPRRAPGGGDAAAEDFVHLLLAVVSLGEAAARCAGPAPDPEPPRPSGTTGATGPAAAVGVSADGWLR